MTPHCHHLHEVHPGDVPEGLGEPVVRLVDSKGNQLLDIGFLRLPFPDSVLLEAYTCTRGSARTGAGVRVRAGVEIAAGAGSTGTW